MDNDNQNLNNPFVVHKVTDSSYEDLNNDVNVEGTHIDESEATLERHRFKKDKKEKNKKPIIVILIILVICVLVFVQYKYDIIKFDTNESTTTSTTEDYLSTTRNLYANTITIKGTYLFFEGEEVDDIDDINRAIKYEDEGTEIIIQSVDADSDILNEVGTLVDEAGLSKKIIYARSTSLMSKNEVKETSSTTTTTTTTTNN